MYNMSNIYRIFPFLWNDATGTNNQSQMVYGIDRLAPQLDTACSRRPTKDPASTWDGPTIDRLLPPPESRCSATINAVTWSTLPLWLSYAKTQGYTLNTDLSTLKPYSDIFITGA